LPATEASFSEPLLSNLGYNRRFHLLSPLPPDPASISLIHKAQI
jgi:hypothetical protein